MAIPLGKLAKGAALFLVAVLAILVVGIGAISVARVQARQLVAPTGASAVGRVELALMDSARVDPFATDGRSRELAVWIWYPTAKGNSAATAPYLPKAWADAANSATGVSVLFQDNNAVRTNSIERAPLLGANPPVVVLMPGLGNSVAEYTELAEELASHGYAVVGINPTGSSQVVGFPDGHLVYGTSQGSIAQTKDVDAWYAAANRLVGVWVDDASFVVSALAKSPPAVGPLDFSRVAYVGHSLGGNASFEACARDSRCVAAVDLDGTVFSQVRTTGLQVPGLILQAPDKASCDEFCRRKNAGFKALTSKGPTAVLVVDGTEHLNFSDTSVLFMPLLRPAGALGSIDGTRAVVIARDLVRTFVDQGVRGTAASTFEATVKKYGELHAP